MIRSMTGFGRAECADSQLKFTVEVRSVNHRYLDASVRMPKEYAFLETLVRTELKKYIGRGKVEVSVTCEQLGEADLSLKLNEQLAQKYVDAYRELEERFGLRNDLTVSRLGGLDGIFTLSKGELDEEVIWNVLRQALDGALEKLVSARETEGGNLKRDLLEKLDGMDSLVSKVQERYPEIIAAYRERIREKISEILSDDQIDENRIASEVVLYADRLATDEETVRLHSHIKAMQKELEKGGDVGRKLDFIAQEMNREANTILSKANDLVTADIGIGLKTEIEKIREQVQNIE